MDRFPNERLSKHVMLRMPPSLADRVAAVAAKVYRCESDVIRMALLYGLPRIEQEPSIMVPGLAVKPPNGEQKR